AAAAVLSARRHCSLAGAQALVLGGTGPVGQRAVELLAAEGACVRVGSRTRERAQATCDIVRASLPDAKTEPVATADPSDLEGACRDVEVIIAAGAAGVELLGADLRSRIPSLRVAI